MLWATFDEKFQPVSILFTIVYFSVCIAFQYNYKLFFFKVGVNSSESKWKAMSAIQSRIQIFCYDYVHMVARFLRRVANNIFKVETGRNSMEIIFIVCVIENYMNKYAYKKRYLRTGQVPLQPGQSFFNK